MVKNIFLFRRKNLTNLFTNPYLTSRIGFNKALTNFEASLLNKVEIMLYQH